MRFRKLRIAFSATCLIACVLLIALWVRSYWNGAGKGYFNSLPDVCSRSTNGFVFFVQWDPPPVNQPDMPQVVLWSEPLQRTKPLDFGPAHTLTGFSFGWVSSSFWHLQMPYWFLVAITASFAAIPWIRWRFSLRTLLIGTTLVAVGLVMWEVR
jgi:hypothetical protein